MKKILKILSVFLLLFMITNTYALEYGKAGNIITQEGEYSSTRLAAGNKVINKATVDGISFVAGNEVTLEGSAPYGFYAGNIVNVNEKVEKDMFVAGNQITIGSDAVIGRDVFIAGNSVTIKSNINRNLNMGATSVDISDITIGGDAYIMADEIIMNEKTVITGKLSYGEDSNVIGLNEATIGSKELVKNVDIDITYTLKDKAIDFLFSLVGAYLVMLVLFYLAPKTKEKLDTFELGFGNIAKTSGIGIIVLILVPLISILAFITRFLIPLSLITLAIYVISIYLSFLLTYYVVGNLITNKLFNKDNKYIALLIGIVLVKLLCYVPYIGGLIGFISLLFGLGLIYKFIVNIRNIDNKKKSTK